MTNHPSAPTVQRPSGEAGLWTARQVADHYAVTRDFIYAHANELGGIRLGTGPRPRLRFDPATVRERWGHINEPPAVARQRSPGRRQAARAPAAGRTDPDQGRPLTTLASLLRRAPFRAPKPQDTETDGCRPPAIAATTSQTGAALAAGCEDRRGPVRTSPLPGYRLAIRMATRHRDLGSVTSARSWWPSLHATGRPWLACLSPDALVGTPGSEAVVTEIYHGFLDNSLGLLARVRR
jgi:hypothetical protein